MAAEIASWLDRYREPQQSGGVQPTICRSILAMTRGQDAADGAAMRVSGLLRVILSGTLMKSSAFGVDARCGKIARSLR